VPGLGALDRQVQWEDGGMAELPERRYRTLAGVYLQQSLDAFRAAGSSDGLYIFSHAKLYLGWPDHHDSKAGLLESGALKQQTEHCRTSILFSALSCEAYVNEYLKHCLGGRDFDAIDRLPTLEKLVIGCRLAGGPIYERGQGDGQTIASLFELRNKLVHPRPGLGRYPSGAEYPNRDDTFNPPTALKYILSVAHVGCTLIQRAFPDPSRLDSPSFEITRGEKFLSHLAHEIDGSVPKPTDEPLPDFVEAIRHSLFRA